MDAALFIFLDNLLFELHVPVLLSITMDESPSCKAGHLPKKSK